MFSDLTYLLESAKLRAWRAFVLMCLACSRAQRAYGLKPLGTYVLACLTCLHARALGVLTC